MFSLTCKYKTFAVLIALCCSFYPNFRGIHSARLKALKGEERTGNRINEPAMDKRVCISGLSVRDSSLKDDDRAGSEYFLNWVKKSQSHIVKAISDTAGNL